MTLPAASPVTLPRMLEIVRGDSWTQRIRMTNKNRDTLAWPNHNIKFQVYSKPAYANVTTIKLLEKTNQLETTNGWITTQLTPQETNDLSWASGVAVWVMILPNGDEHTILRAELRVKNRGAL